MLECPYCFEELPGPANKCPHCLQFIIDPLVEVDYRSIDKKKCIFCGKKILSEARICKHCRKWNDKIDQAADDIREIEE